MQLQPTPQEAKIAFELQKGVNNALGNQNFFDVDDELDILEKFPTCFDLPQYPPAPTAPPFSPQQQPDTPDPPPSSPPTPDTQCYCPPKPYSLDPLRFSPSTPSPQELIPYDQLHSDQLNTKPMQKLANAQSYYTHNPKFYPQMPLLYRQGRSVGSSVHTELPRRCSKLCISKTNECVAICSCIDYPFSCSSKS